MLAIDPITLKVFWNRLITIAEEQAQAIIRAAFSPMIRECTDLSSGIFDTQGRMLAQSITGAPGHTNSMPEAAKHMLRRYPPASLSPGDFLITNDPWITSGHRYDITIMKPIFRGNLFVGLMGSCCHTADIGGQVFSADAREVFEEGLGIPILKLFRGGQINADLVDMIHCNSRLPENTIGDILAQVAAANTAADKLLKLIQEYGFSDLGTPGNEILSRSTEAVRSRIASIRDGTYRDEIWIDGFDDPLRIAVAVTVSGHSIRVDYAGTSPQVPRGINVVLNHTKAFTIYALRCALYPSIPNNEGSIVPVEVVAPEGCLLNARFPAAVGGRHLVTPFVIPAIFGAISLVAPDCVVADGAPLTITSLHGGRSNGKAFVLATMNWGGEGAGPTRDGYSATAHFGNIGNAPIEVLESTFPLRICRKELICDSGGAGEHRGGLGQLLEMIGTEPIEISLQLMHERVRHPARGFFGGKPGKCCGVILNENSHPHPKSRCTLRLGDRLRLELAGGGGYGPPGQRPPVAVLADVLNGYVSPASAAQDYGVAVTSDLRAIDWGRTQALRQKLAEREDSSSVGLLGG